MGRFDEMRRRLGIGIQRIADVERENFVSMARDFVGDAGQIADGTADVFEASGGSDFASLRDAHVEILTATLT